MPRPTPEERLDQLAGIFRHDLRNTLTGVSGVADLLRDELHGQLPPDQEELIELILSSARELEQQLDTLVELVRLDAGTLPLRRERAPFSAICHRAAAQAGAAAPAISPDPTIEADITRLERGLTRLFGLVGPASVGAVTISTSEGSAHLRLPCDILSDEQRAALSNDPWTRSDGSPRRSFGTDLSLAWLAALVRAHGGELRVEPAQILHLRLPGSP